MEASPPLIDPAILKGLADPVRVHILDILSEGPSSPSRIQKRMENVSLKKVCYHVKVLLDLELIELEKVVRGRGGKEHIYRAKERQFIDTEEWESTAPRFRAPVTATTLRVISEDVDKALIDGRFDERPDNHLSRSPVEVDEKGWRELVSILAKALDKVLETHERSAARVEKSGEELMTARVVMMQFLLERGAKFGRVPPRKKRRKPPKKKAARQG
jgi:DNA-binding transcriptional ArsR family regulator